MMKCKTELVCVALIPRIIIIVWFEVILQMTVAFGSCRRRIKGVFDMIKGERREKGYNQSLNITFWLKFFEFIR